MNGRNTFQLYFYVRKIRKDKKGKAPIYLRITCAGEQSTISINRSVTLSAWDAKRGYAKPKTTDAEEINPFLDLLKAKAYQVHRKLLDDGGNVVWMI